ncbi:glycine betaine transporter [Dethiosulfatibacter aminovorans DSM 17477]|uniref:Glycine betaine transporter n=1 Tax=Dethiosulfatibacter aminovorans DSM 17477 TaxID=1121476 RepID=A0A1M6HYS4_9FIRM|nr:BCCT family transporter [Dethiosulfatibacter aminovorans]SHJ27399.1 glycine betaine transporter [Dethiosulfatibacter aminovorans DSM 17477]
MKKNNGFLSMINKSLFFPPAIILTIGVLLGAFNPEGFGKGSSIALNFTLKYFSWAYCIGAIILTVFCFWAGFSKYGRIKLGGPDAKPTMGRFTWFAVTFTSSLAIGISFYCVAEPMMHYMNPPTFLGIAGSSVESAQIALRYTYLHWAFIPFAIYVSAGVACAFMFYNARRSFKVSSSLYPLIGDKVDGMIGNTVDALAIFAMVGGIGTSFGLGTLQIGAGMDYLWGFETGPAAWTTIICVMVAIYTTSACTGLHKGIKYISTANMYMYFFLLFAAFIFGPKISILENILTAVGDYLDNLIPMAFNLDPIKQTGWTKDWTMFYWAWWLAFAPLTGLFMVKLAKGRTIREFVTMNLIAPATFVIIWFGIFGSASIFMDHFGGTAIGETINQFGAEVALFAFLKELPLAGITSVVGLLVVAASFITQAEAVSLTLSTMTTVGFDDAGNEQNPPRPVTIFWGVLMGAIALILLLTGGAKALQTSVIVCGLPIIVLQLVMAGAHVKAMINAKDYDQVGTFDENNQEQYISQL